MQIRVAVPAYDHKVSAETARALLNEQGLASLAGHLLEVEFLPGCSLITQARNQLAQGFLDSEADRLVFVDADISWELGALLKLALHPCPFVGGAYRLKQPAEDYSVLWLSRQELWADSRGLIEVDALPAGFLALDRAVFETMRGEAPRPYFHHGHPFNAYFTAGYREGRLEGEDMAFCLDWRALGGSVWLDPELEITHHDGARAFPGHIGRWLKSGAGLSQAA